MACINQNSVKWTRSNEKDEYIGNKFQGWLRRRAINLETTTAHSPESSEAAKRLNRMLLDMLGTMILHLNEPRQNLWAEATNTACLLHKRLLSQSCGRWRMPYEIKTIDDQA